MAERRTTVARLQVFSSPVLASLILGSAAALACGLVAWGSVAWAEEGAAPADQRPPEQSAAAAQDPAAAPAGTSQAATSQAGASPDVPAPAAPKAAPRPVHVLTIAADESQVARLKTLAQLVPGQPVKIIKAGHDPKAGGAADFAVKTVLQPAGDRTKSREARLFTEQLHIIASAGITRVEDLGGRVVSFGADGSAGQIAARRAFEALGVRVKETPLDLDNALDGAATGDVDAVVVLAPQPFERLKGLSPSGLHLLSWPDKAALPPGTLLATIAGDQYPGLAKSGETFRAVGVDAVLAVSPKGAKQPAARRFLSAIAQHSAALSKRGFDLLKAEGESATGRRVASNDGR